MKISHLSIICYNCKAASVLLNKALLKQAKRMYGEENKYYFCRKCRTCTGINPVKIHDGAVTIKFEEWE